MTGTGRPGEAARRALRAARERAEAQREGTAREAEPQMEGTPREAEAQREGTPREAEGPLTEPVPTSTGPATEGAVEPEAARSVSEAARAVPEAARTEPETGAKGSDSAGGSGAPGTSGAAGASGASGVSGVSGVSGASPAKGPRPADAAREALRAARREALRAAEAPRERRAATRSAPAAPRTSPGREAGAARVKAVQDMRHYLATAFRMPTWTETTDEPAEPADTTTASAEPTASTSPTASAEPTASTSPTASAEPTASTSPTASAEPAASTSPTASAEPAASTSPTASVEPAAATVSTASVESTASTSPTASVEPATATSPHAPPAPGRSPASRPSARIPASASSPPVPSPEESAPPEDVPSPTVPASMATPHRDSELRRTYPAFAARESAGADGEFAGTWWGNAWVGALEQGALDAKRLARGRDYADQGHVDAITVTPGLVLAYVRGSRPRPYRVQVRVRTLEDEDWARFLDAAADRPGHIAALLDKELPQSLADCGVSLLPGPGDLGPRCSCPDSGHPCKHAAALCYQTARLLDADPFVLLLLRGRGEKELLDALSRRSAARAARAAQEKQSGTLPGVRAAEALAPRELPPLPPPLPVPPHPGQPPVYPSAPGGPDPFALDQLATDAAARAHALLGTGRDPVGELSLWQDAVRLAAARPGSGLTAATRSLYAALADAVGRTPADLARAVAAWRQGGPAGLAALEEPWDPPAGRFDRARPLLLAADLPAFRPWRNRLTHPRAHVQLRLGRDGLWYAYESEPGQDDWWPRGTPDLDPVGALTGIGTPDGLDDL